MTRDTNADEYLMGHTPQETERLQKQALLYDPSTRALFEAAGLRRGMRVLELGTGAGDVAMLAAELVGPSGEVVSVDRDPAGLRTARQRAQGSNLTQISFVESKLEELSVSGDRYVRRAPACRDRRPERHSGTSRLRGRLDEARPGQLRLAR